MISSMRQVAVLNFSNHDVFLTFINVQELLTWSTSVFIILVQQLWCVQFLRPNFSR